MANRQHKTDKMAGTGIRRLKREEYPFGEVVQEAATFSDLFDGDSFDDGALQRELARRVEEKEKRPQVRADTRNGLPPQESLDLHGYTGQEAEDKTRRFIEDAGRRGVKMVRIITGKGLHSPGGKAVLPDLIELQLGLLKRAGTIVAFQWDRQVKSRSGALVVYL